MFAAFIMLCGEVAARAAQLAAVNIQLQEEVAARTAVQQELQLADRRKDEFLATLAHELRNPLASNSLSESNRRD